MTAPQLERDKPTGLLVDTDSRFLNALDFLVDGKWVEVSLTISAVHEPNKFESKGRKLEFWGLSFKETTKMFLLTARTNIKLIKAVCGGKNASEWIGKKIRLYPVSGEWFGESGVGGVRVRVPKGTVHLKVDKKDLGRDLTGTSVNHSGGGK